MRYLSVDGLPRVSRVGLGTMRFGERGWDPARSGMLVRRALELGVTVFDTAEGYGGGRSERLLGEALGERRDEVLVTTKFLPLAPLPRVTVAHARASRERLGLARIPLYLLHMPSPLPDPVVMSGLRRAREQGIVHSVGVSNYGLRSWRSAEAALGAPVVANQVLFNLLHRRAASDQVPWAAERERLVIAASPLAQGMLGAGYDEDHPPPHRGIRRVALASSAFVPARENLRRAAPLMALLRELAAAHGATPSQISLAWLLHHPAVLVIPGASSLEQLESNVAAADIELAGAEHAALTAEAERLRPLNPVAALLPRR
ncbi:MAG TPA: aldo/keto reductase [Candidatus Dormibacteraeota bacterium]|nr:aldo/keto reductase [Candidatus Dormibacteraeota bacterium]